MSLKWIRHANLWSPLGSFHTGEDPQQIKSDNFRMTWPHPRSILRVDGIGLSLVLNRFTAIERKVLFWPPLQVRPVQERRRV